MVHKRKRGRSWSPEDLVRLPPNKPFYNEHCCFYKCCRDLIEDGCPGTSKERCSCADDDDDLDKSHYDKWNAKVDICQYLSWFKSRDIACLLKWIRKIDYADPKSRQNALDKLNKICDRVPYSRFARFPETFHVLEGNGRFAKRLQQLRCLLEVKEFPVIKKDGQKKDVKDVCKCYRSAATDILGELAKGTDVYDRKKFEESFQVVWTEVPSKTTTTCDDCNDDPIQLTDDDDSFV